MEKYIKDGEVAILVSRGFGAGWSTWGSNSEFLCMDKTLVQMKMDGASAESVAEYCKKTIDEDPYTGGWDSVEVEWLDEGAQFTIEEYDGNESLTLISDLSMTA